MCGAKKRFQTNNRRKLKECDVINLRCKTRKSLLKGLFERFVGQNQARERESENEHEKSWS